MARTLCEYHWAWPRVSQPLRVARRRRRPAGARSVRNEAQSGTLDLFARLGVPAEVAAGGEVERAVKVAQAHSRDEFVQAGDFVGAVKAVVAVPFVDDVVVLGVEPAADFGVAAELVHHHVVVPAPVAVARAAVVAPDIAAFAVEQRLAGLGAAADEIPFRAGEGVAGDLVEMLAPGIAREIGMPGIDVGRDVVKVAGRVVFDQARRVELFGQAIDRGNPFLGFGLVTAVAAFAAHQAPGLVEGDPGKNGGVVEIAAQHPAQRHFDFPAHVRVRFAPTVGHVGHEQQAQAVGPIELAGHVHFDVQPVGVETQAARTQNLIAHETIAGESVEPFGMIGLVERHPKVNRLIVQGHVRKTKARHIHDADFSHAEVRADAVFGIARAQDGLDFVKKGVLQRPMPGVGYRNRKLDLSAAGGHGLGDLGQIAGLELKPQLGARRSRGAQARRHGHLRLVEVGCEMEALEPGLGAGLQIDRLPDAAGIAVALFALELEGPGRIVHAQHELMAGARLEAGRQLELEWNVAAAVSAQRLSVQPGPRLPVASPDDQEHAPVLPIVRHAHRPRIPGHGGLVRDLGQSRAPRERHRDRLGEIGRTLEPFLGNPMVLLVEPELPGTVQVKPRRPLKIRPGMLRQGNRGIDRPNRGTANSTQPKGQQDSEQANCHRCSA